MLVIAVSISEQGFASTDRVRPAFLRFTAQQILGDSHHGSTNQTVRNPAVL